MSHEYRITKQDYLEAVRANLKRQRALYILLWVLTVIVIIGGIGYLVWGILGDPGRLFEAFLFLFLGIYLNPGLSIFQRWAVGKAWKNHPSLREIMSFEFDETEMRTKGESFDSNLKWSLFTQYLETTNLFLLYPANNIFHLFPKRAFESEEELQRFREIIQSQIVKRG